MKTPRHRIVPLPDQQVAFMLDGVERARWHFGDSYPRPFLYPIIGPSGSSLTRMGHPGAPNHDHHRSVWFAHEKVLGINFWSDRTEASIRQLEWLCYVDGDQSAVMAVLLGWFDGHDPAPLLTQQVVISAAPSSPDGETLIELQSTFHPAADSIEFGQTNFGFLAVRVARELSSYFGGGRISANDGRSGEPSIFGTRAEWIDYSGQVTEDAPEGITYFDHPENISYPSKWHVREDGWMGASVCRDGPVTTTRTHPLRLRYLLHVHRDEVDTSRAAGIQESFHASRPFEVIDSQRQHVQYEVRRVT